ncbi:hypothetical protein MKX01_034127 [Papaver californicum]|nr:hypothetical protein MKX01_034127 [Papaver californicum]
MAFSGSSSSDSDSSINQTKIENLRSKHKIERDMYRKLTLEMRKEPLVCMAVMALWIFMEELGYPKVISMLLSCQNDMINSAFAEAELLVHHIVTRIPPPSSLIDMPITLRLIDAVGSRKYIPMKNLFEHGIIPYIEIKSKVQDLCGTLFEDIFREAMSGNNTTNTTIHSQRLFDEINGSSSSVPRVDEPQVVRVTPPNERTMFIKFSRGFPISEDQLREFFVRTYGDCIESIYMQDCKIVFHAGETIDHILAGQDKVGFFINGREFQARKFEARE